MEPPKLMAPTIRICVIVGAFIIMTDQPNIPDCFYRVSIKALVTDVQGRFLLLQEADGRWSLPGGGYEHGDISPYEALRRELDEEI